MIFLGIMCLFFVVLNLIGSIVYLNKGNKTASHERDKEMVLWFIAMVICFK